MPSPWHDTAIKLFEEDPAFGVTLLRDILGIALQPGQRVLTDKTVFNTRPSKELVPDTVILVGSGSKVSHGIVVEAQREPTERKRRQLPRYAAALWLEHECAVDVLVLCPDEATSEWYAEPIPTLVPGFTFLPTALHPRRVPAITDPDEVTANPSLAVLSVAYHGDDPAVAGAFVAGMGNLGPERGLQYYEYGYSMSSKAVCQLLEELVTTADSLPRYSPFAKKHYGDGLAEGRIEAEREALLDVLAARDLAPTRDDRQRILDCADFDQLKTWHRKAVTVARVSDLFS
jgi:hypothetical protein